MKNTFELFNKVSTGILIIDSYYKIIFWNKVLESWTGLKYNEVIGKNASEEFEQIGNPKIQSRLDSVFTYGTPVILSSQIHKYLILSDFPGGKNRYQHTVVTSLKDPDDETKILAIFSIQDVTDITEKALLYKKIYKQIESQNNDLEIASQNLEKSNKSIQQIVEYSRDAIIIIQDDAIVFCNSAFRSIMKSKLHGANYTEFIKIQNPESQVTIESISALLTTRESYDTSLELLDMKKNIVFAEGRFRKIEFEGKPSVLGIIRDMTEKIQLLELLYKNDKKSIESGKLITICASCHNVKEDKSDHFTWTKIDDFLKKLTGKSISHGICNNCFEKEYPKYYKQFVNKHMK